MISTRPQDLCRIIRESGGVVANFDCEYQGKSFIIKGQTTSYYYKQVAQEAIKRVLPSNFRVINEIVVS